MLLGFRCGHYNKRYLVRNGNLKKKRPRLAIYPTLPIIRGMTLHRWRTKNNLTQTEAAKRLGITQVFVCRIETGSVNVSLSMALEIERRLCPDVRAEDLPMSAETRKAMRRLRAQMRPIKSKQAG